MNRCDTCKHFRMNGSWRVPNPPDIREGKSYSTAPHCTYNPLWVEIKEPTEHFCGHWQEPDIETGD